MKFLLVVNKHYVCADGGNILGIASLLTHRDIGMLYLQNVALTHIGLLLFNC